MPGTRPGMTENVKSGRSAKAPEADWQGAENRARMAGKEQPAAPSRRHQDGPHDISHYLCLCLGGLPGRRGRSGATRLADRRAAVRGCDQRPLVHAAVPVAGGAGGAARSQGQLPRAGAARRSFLVCNDRDQQWLERAHAVRRGPQRPDHAGGAPLAAIYPLVTVALSAMLLKHIEITARIVAGAALTVLNVVLVLIG